MIDIGDEVLYSGDCCEGYLLRLIPGRVIRLHGLRAHVRYPWGIQSPLLENLSIVTKIDHAINRVDGLPVRVDAV